MASNDNLLKLYNGLKDNNFSVPDNFESFERTLAAPGNEGVNNRQTLYKALKRSNYSVPDNYESFRNTLFGPDIDLAGEALGEQAGTEAGTTKTETGPEAGGESPLTSERPPETVERQPAATETQPAVSAESALPVMADGTPDIDRAADAESGRRAVLEMFDGDTVAAREYVAATMGALEAEAEALRKPQGYGRELADNIRRRRSLEKKIERLKEIDNALTETPAEQLPTEPEINKAAGDSGRVPVYADGTPNFLAAKPVDAYDALLKWMGGDKGAADDYIMEMRIRL